MTTLLAADENCGGFFGGGAVNGAGFRAAGGCGLHLAEGAEQHVGERTVHRLRHDDREDEAGGSVERAGDDQKFVVENESHGRGGESGVAVEQRDDGGHVRAADGNDQQDAEDQRRCRRSTGKNHSGFGMQNQIDRAADGDSEEQKVDDVLAFIGDGALRKNFL